MIGTSIIELEYFFLIFTIILSVASLVDSKSVWKPKKITVTEEVLADADFDIVTVAQTLCLAIASSQRSSLVACFNEEEKRCFAYSGEVSEDSSPSSGWICSLQFVEIGNLGRFYLSPGVATMTTAKQNCPQGTKLLTMEGYDAAMATELSNYLLGGTSSDYWVDLSTDGEHGYTWGHGGALPLDSGLWNPGKPDIPGTGGEEMCAGLLNANGRVVGLDDHHCSRMSNYICKVIAT